MPSKSPLKFQNPLSTFNPWNLLLAPVEYIYSIKVSILCKMGILIIYAEMAKKQNRVTYEWFTKMLQFFSQGQEDPLKDCTPWSTFSAPYIVNKFPVKPLQLYKVNSILWSFDVIKRFGLLPRGGSIQSKASLFIWGYGLSGHQNIEAKYRGISMDYGTAAIWHMPNWSNKVSAFAFLIFLYFWP